MTKAITLLLFLATTLTPGNARSIIEVLQDQIREMKESDKLQLDYVFQGCFGPYHHGTIAMELRSDTVYFTHQSKDDKNENPLAESGKYHQDRILELLATASSKRSSAVYGNEIGYTIHAEKRELSKGTDQIEQRHFIGLFQPFSTIFHNEQDEIIPKLRMGGFVH
ncbi:MAG: hypothetical protein OEQ53_07030 [Saprospiraceae bacterium]|nr:hypothetical protein [Saprospiraceae bacterium]